MNLSSENLINKKIIKNPVLRHLVYAFGWLSVVLGVIGIFLPVMPTTPFLLLAAACFTRTSPKIYTWITGHPQLAKYVVPYLEGQGMPLKAKVYTLVMLWFTIILSAFIILDSKIVRVILPILGLLVSIYIMYQPTLKLNSSSK